MGACDTITDYSHFHYYDRHPPPAVCPGTGRWPFGRRRPRRPNLHSSDSYSTVTAATTINDTTTTFLLLPSHLFFPLAQQQCVGHLVEAARDASKSVVGRGVPKCRPALPPKDREGADGIVQDLNIKIGRGTICIQEGRGGSTQVPPIASSRRQRRSTPHSAGPGYYNKRTSGMRGRGGQALGRETENEQTANCNTWI